METVLLWLLFQVMVKTWVDLPDLPDLKVEINIQERVQVVSALSAVV